MIDFCSVNVMKVLNLIRRPTIGIFLRLNKSFQIALNGKDVMINFTANLVPMNRGILSTIYLKSNKPGLSLQEIEKNL